MGVVLEGKGHKARPTSLPRLRGQSAFSKQGFHCRHVPRHIHSQAEERRICDADGHAGRQRSQLLQHLQLLERVGWQLGEGAERIRSIRINPQVALEGCQLVRSHPGSEVRLENGWVAKVGYGAATEVERSLLVTHHHLDGVRIEEVIGVQERAGRRPHGEIWLVPHEGHHRGHGIGMHGRLVPLDVEDAIKSLTKGRQGCGRSIGSGGQGRIGHDGLASESGYDRGDAIVIRGDHHSVHSLGPEGRFENPLDHWLPCNGGQGFTGEPGGREPGWEYGEGAHGPSVVQGDPPGFQTLLPGADVPGTGSARLDQSLDDVWAEFEDLFGQARQTLATLKEPQPAHVVQASVNSLFRTTHTLKGMAGMLGFPSFSKAAHRMEDIFDLMRKGRLRSTDSLVETLEAGILALESGVAGLRRGRSEPEDYLQSLRRQLGELEALARPAEGASQDLTSLIDLPPEVLKALSEYEHTRVTALLMSGMPIHGVKVCLDFATFDERLRVFSEALGSFGELISTLPWDVPGDREGLAFLLMTACPVLDPAQLPALEGELLGTDLLADPARVPTSLRDEGQAQPVEVPTPEPQAVVAPVASSQAQEVEILRLPAHRVEALEARLMAVGQLRDEASLLLRRTHQAHDDRPMALMGHIEDGLLDVQKSLLQMRMVKVESLFSRIEPMVKSLSRDTGKPVKLTFQGGDLELERSILGKLTEPFLHMVRNAVDHGLETPSERAALGKSETGSLRISAAQRGRNLRFDIRDDGRGFNLERIEIRGLELGLLKAGEVHTPERLHRLTLEPGFSTQDTASQLSGRGVGMDVVRAEIEALGGEVHLSSEARRGSLIRLSLPLSRAVVSCLKVRSAGQGFGIPLGSVVRVQAGRAVCRGGDQVLVLGRSLPLESLQACLGLPEPDGQRAFVVLSQQGAAARSVEVALGVDEIVGRGEVLLRSLPELAHAAGIMGGSLQEEGILWVLDPDAILGLAMDSLMRRVARV